MGAEAMDSDTDTGAAAGNDTNPANGKPERPTGARARQLAASLRRRSLSFAAASAAAALGVAAGEYELPRGGSDNSVEGHVECLSDDTCTLAWSCDDRDVPAADVSFPAPTTLLPREVAAAGRTGRDQRAVCRLRIDGAHRAWAYRTHYSAGILITAAHVPISRETVMLHTGKIEGTQETLLFSSAEGLEINAWSYATDEPPTTVALDADLTDYDAIYFIYATYDLSSQQDPRGTVETERIPVGAINATSFVSAASHSSISLTRIHSTGARNLSMWHSYRSSSNRVAVLFAIVGVAFAAP